MLITNIKNYPNIKIENGVIKDIDSKLNNDEKLDAGGQILLPQFIDLNVFPKNKTLNKNNLLSLAKRAKNGGIGVIALHSDNNYATDNEIVIEFINNIHSDILILPLIASNNANGKICDISILHSLGGVGINLKSIRDANSIDKIAKYAKMLDIPIFINADDELGGMVNYGEISATLGLPARNPLSEIKEVAKMLEVAIFYNIKAVFSNISEIRSLELINTAKKHNPNIFAEVSIHHLLLNDEACINYNTNAKINPPLKDEKTRECLIEYLKNGKIDLLTSLQCASYNSKKEQVFGDAEFGIDSIAHYFSLLYTKLVQTKIITLEQLVDICAKNPATILNLNCGEVKVNKEAKLMLIDLNDSYKIQDSYLPYNGWEMNAKIKSFI